MKHEMNLPKAPEGMSLLDAIRVACIAFGTSDSNEENARPEYILCDEIWDILDEAGHGTPVLIHHNGAPTEVLIYDRYATQRDNVRFMNHISEALDDGSLVTVNGTNIYDLY